LPYSLILSYFATWTKCVARGRNR